VRVVRTQIRPICGQFLWDLTLRRGSVALIKSALGSLAVWRVPRRFPRRDRCPGWRPGALLHSVRRWPRSLCGWRRGRWGRAATRLLIARRERALARRESAGLHELRDHRHARLRPSGLSRVKRYCIARVLAEKPCIAADDGGWCASAKFCQFALKSAGFKLVAPATGLMVFGRRGRFRVRLAGPVWLRWSGHVMKCARGQKCASGLASPANS
jgi:hypothetical protein